MRRPFLIFAMMLALGAQVHAQPANSAAQPTIRFHYGDDPRWASPDFDDSSWPITADGKVKPPPFESDGFLWVRVHLSVPPNTHEPLGVQSIGANHGPGVQAIFVDGRVAGQAGRFPPEVSSRHMPRSLTFPVPSNFDQSGTTAVVAFRGWYLPIQRLHGEPEKFAFVIDRMQILALAAQGDSAVSILASLPAVIPNALLVLLGFVLLGLFRRVKSHELMLNALWLITVPMYVLAYVLVSGGFIPLSSYQWLAVYIVIVIPGFWIDVEFIWTVNQIPGRFFRYLTQALWMFYVITDLFVLCERPAAWLSTLVLAGLASLTLFNVGCLSANLWALFFKRSNRTIAAAFTLINIPFLLAIAGAPETFKVGPAVFSYQTVGFFVAGVTITAMLVRRAIDAWQTGQNLRVELLAAREVQQRLVPAQLPRVEGFQIEAAYIPAAEVGGDFYQVLPQSDGASLIVVGDVSGKGLKAAMKGVLALGALRALAADMPGPAALLAGLNREMLRAEDGGFITCICLRVSADGAVVIANAGHLSPYRNGVEVEVESNLPLGIVSDVEYAETAIQLEPRDQLTLLSDGVLEATSASGELLGFERMREMSTQSAETTAHTAQHFGQEDDITVLTLQRTVPA
jgi:hypothetical protein